MDLIHITITFQDTFSGAKVIRNCTRSMETFEKMRKQVGEVVIDRFNKATHIHETLRLISVEQSK